MAILKAKATTQQRNISARIPAELHAELESLKQEADAAGFNFCVSELVTDALAKAAKQARAELNAVVKQAVLQNVLQPADDGASESAGSLPDHG